MIYGRYETPLDPRAPDFFPSEVTKNSHGLRNEPDSTQWAMAKRLAVEVLEPLRRIVGPITITNWFRSAELNRVIRGASTTSEHMRGMAVDLVNDWFTNRELAAYLWTRSDLPLGEVIWYRSDGHLHVSIDPRNRREFLVANRDGDSASYAAWKPESGEVDRVLRKIAGHSRDAGGGDQPSPVEPSRPHPAAPHVSAGGDGGGLGGILLVGAAIAIGKAMAPRRKKN